MFGWLKKDKPASGIGQDTVTVYLNPLIALLAGAEAQKGRPLTEAEVLDIRDTAVCVQMSPEKARAFHASLDAQVPVHRIDPEHIWEEWQTLRDEVE